MWEARSAFSVFLLLLHVWVVEVVGFLVPVPRKVGLTCTEHMSEETSSTVTVSSVTACSVPQACPTL